MLRIATWKNWSTMVSECLIKRPCNVKSNLLLVNNLHHLVENDTYSGAPARWRQASGAPFLRKFGNLLISNILVVIWLSVCMSICMPSPIPWKIREKHYTCIGASLILDIHVMINWQLPNPGIHWPVSHDHIAGSGQELIKFACFLKLAGFSLNCGLMPGYYSGGNWWSTCKGKHFVQTKLPWHIVDFF